MDNESRLRLLYSELEKTHLNKNATTSRIFLSCPFGKHSDSTPSVTINIDPTSKYPIGAFYCFGCGESGGWNKLANKLGLQPFDKNKQQEYSYAPPRISDKANKMLEVEDITLEGLLPEWNCIMPMPFSVAETWRGIRGDVLYEIGAQYAFDDRFKKVRVILPCTVEGELVGAIRAAQQKEKPSYLNSAGSWVKTKGLFPFDYVKAQETDYVVLVEGPRDALRLLQDGITAMAILGTNNWGDTKRDIVLSMDRQIFIMMDGDLPRKKNEDPPGTAANKLVKASFTETKAECRVINLAKVGRRLGRDIDPANAPRRVIKRIKEICSS